jgi:hypothetical protein
VRDGTEQGELGIFAKAATHLNPPKKGKNEWLICVYTYDKNDHDDVRRVLKRLRRLGIEQQLVYKADSATSSGIYGAGSALYVSQAGTVEFDVR